MFCLQLQFPFRSLLVELHCPPAHPSLGCLLRNFLNLAFLQAICSLDLRRNHRLRNNCQKIQRHYCNPTISEFNQLKSGSRVLKVLLALGRSCLVFTHFSMGPGRSILVCSQCKTNNNNPTTRAINNINTLYRRPSV